jgi:hypothetical protein
MLGVLGLAAKTSGDISYLNLNMKDGRCVVYQVKNLPPQKLRAQLLPVFRQVGVHKAGEEPGGPAPRGVSVADELTKLAGLRDQGIIDDDEFAAPTR